MSPTPSMMDRALSCVHLMQVTRAAESLKATVVYSEENKTSSLGSDITIICQLVLLF